MKKLILCVIFALFIIACGDNGVSAESEYNYTPQKIYSSSSVRQAIYSSSATKITISSSSSINIIQRPSSSSVSLSLEEICDMAAANVLNANNISSKAQVCNDYKNYLANVVGMTKNDLNYCMVYETCDDAKEPQACDMGAYDSGFSEEYLRSLCAKYQAQGYYTFQNCSCSAITKSTNKNVSKCNTTCATNIRNQATSNGTGRSSSTAIRIEQECGCTCINNNPLNCR